MNEAGPYLLEFHPGWMVNGVEINQMVKWFDTSAEAEAWAAKYRTPTYQVAVVGMSA